MEKEKEIVMKIFNGLEKFNSPDDIPSIPVVDEEIYNDVIIPNLIRCGAIPKKDLIVGMEYEGSCRNATKAIWTGKEFEYQRYKFGWFTDTINHFEDDDGYDVFVPIKEIKP